MRIASTLNASTVNTSTFNADTPITSNTREPGARPRVGLARAAGLAAALVLTATACGGARPELGAAPDSTTSTPISTSTPIQPATVAPTTSTPESSEDSTPIRAISKVENLQVLAEPNSTVTLALLSERTDFGSARVLLVEQVIDGWVEVELPIRPNETSGWVRADDVTLEEIDALVEVDLDARTITTWIDGDVVLETSVAIGSPANPTPTGTFFVTDKIETVDAASAYGPYALGLSAHSDTLTEFAGGDGQIGIHGTNAPDSIGEAVSHGCVRLPNELISVLATTLPLGTPVIIR